MKRVYRKYKVEYKSKDGVTYDVTVNTVDMVAAHEMVEDIMDEGDRIINITEV